MLQINYITKRRALRYVAAAKRDWLHPEKRLRSSHWSKFGSGYLLMPEPRDVYMGGEVWVGYKDGSSAGFSELGHKTGQPGFKDEKKFAIEARALRDSKPSLNGYKDRVGVGRRVSLAENAYASHNQSGPFNLALLLGVDGVTNQRVTCPRAMQPAILTGSFRSQIG